MKTYEITVHLSNGQEIEFENEYSDESAARNRITTNNSMTGSSWYSYKNGQGVGFFLKDEVISIFIKESGDPRINSI